jgi:hypothetical protein
MAWPKKAQAGAAVLVALVALLIIMYVLFLPPAERAKLLGDTPSGGTTGPGGTSNLLFSTPVGKVYPKINPTAEHSLPALTLRTIEESNLLTSRDSITASSNVFEKTVGNIIFNAQPSRTQNAVLSLNLASKTGGRVIILLNGEEIYNQEVKSRSVPPITLYNLREENTLEFTTSGVGFAFWRTNRYTLADVKVVADVTDYSNARTTQSFSIGKEEFTYMETAQFSFVPLCNREGRVSIMLNGVQLYDNVPDCGVVNTLEIAPEKLQPGENSMMFSTENGDFLLDRPAVRTSGKKFENRVFRFTTNPATIQGRKVNMRVLFADTSDKQGILLINGNSIPFRAQDVTVIPITQYLRAGENTVQFEAANKDFEVVKFDVLLG